MKLPILHFAYKHLADVAVKRLIVGFYNCNYSRSGSAQIHAKRAVVITKPEQAVHIRDKPLSVILMQFIAYCGPYVFILPGHEACCQQRAVPGIIYRVVMRHGFRQNPS